MTTISFENGTVVLNDERDLSSLKQAPFVFDSRTHQWRAEARHYRDTVIKLTSSQVEFEDNCRTYQKNNFSFIKPIKMRADQEKALDAWVSNKGQGVVCLPTGAGKSILALLAIVKVGRPTMVVVPTIDLLMQWQSLVQELLGLEAGGLGGGQNNIQDITIATYDSASVAMERLGHKFGLLVVDEAHHLPAECYQAVARLSIAPFRLGLSATPERVDGQEKTLFELMGPIVYRVEISQITNHVLAPYHVETIEVDLNDDESRDYQQARGEYISFIRRHGINVAGHGGWQDFIRKSSYLPGGRVAMKGYRQQKQIAHGARAKIDTVWKILNAHKGERIVVFTNDNATAYKIGTLMILPVLTHHTKAAERKSMLQDFRSGVLRILVTSKVLNEGVDVPEASVAIVVSGSAAVREHVQRLGRVLRHRPGKHATLYEIIAKDTSEKFVNKRRRNHDAYSEMH
jgi:superfamily II DNA or RNA helicase